MKASPAKGFGFYNWGQRSADRATTQTLTFTMASNLTITAYFKEMTRPTNAITSPGCEPEMDQLRDHRDWQSQ